MCRLHHHAGVLALFAATICSADDETKHAPSVLYGFRSVDALQSLQGQELPGVVDLQVRNKTGDFETLRPAVPVVSVEYNSDQAIKAVFVRLTTAEMTAVESSENAVRLWIKGNPEAHTSETSMTAEVDNQLPGARLRNALMQRKGTRDQSIEVFPNYVVAYKRDDSEIWDDVYDAFANGHYDGSAVAVLRVMLEDDPSDDKITILPKPGQMYFPAKTKIPDHSGTQSAHAVKRSGQFIGIRREGSNDTTVRVESPRHLPAEFIVEWSNELAIRCYDIMLRKPTAAELGRMVVVLHDTNGKPMPDWSLMYGPITFGGPYGESAKLNEAGKYVVDGLAAQSFEIGFNQRMHQKWRTEIDVKPGVTTYVEYQLDADGELDTPKVTYE